MHACVRDGYRDSGLLEGDGESSSQSQCAARTLVEAAARAPPRRLAQGSSMAASCQVPPRRQPLHSRHNHIRRAASFDGHTAGAGMEGLEEGEAGVGALTVFRPGMQCGLLRRDQDPAQQPVHKRRPTRPAALPAGCTSQAGVHSQEGEEASASDGGSGSPRVHTRRSKARHASVCFAQRLERASCAPAAGAPECVAAPVYGSGSVSPPLDSREAQGASRYALCCVCRVGP